MKKTYKYAVIGVLSLLLAGCEDFLDKREDSGGLTEDAVYSSYESIRGFLDQVYPKLEAYNTFEGADDGKNQRTYVGVMGDEMSATYNKTAFAKFFSGSWLTTDKAANVAEVGNGNNTPVGKALPAIRIVNRVIANIDKVPLTGEQRNEILGQAYFYRAWFYFNVIKRYGGMPILDVLFAGGDDDIPRVTYHESSAWMVGDIDQAISMLPDTWPDNQYGRPTKLAALAFKEMALLYDASPLMQNDLNSVQIKSYDQERAKAAAKAAWAAITYMKQNEAKTGVRLATADEYMNLFWFPDTELKRVETIWWRRRIPSDTDRSKTVRAFWLYADMTGGTGSESFALCCPTLKEQMVFTIRLMIPGRVTVSIRNMLSLIVTLVSTTTSLFLVILGELIRVGNPITSVCGEVVELMMPMRRQSIPTGEIYRALCAGSLYGRRQTFVMMNL